MSSLSRLDRLLLLLDTNASSSVRLAAAKQIATIAAKSVSEEIHQHTAATSAVHLHAQVSDWSQLLSVLSRILPFFRSKSYDTRNIVSVLLKSLFELIPSWKPRPPLLDTAIAISPAPQTPPSFSVAQILQSSQLLLASSGKEFSKPLESEKDLARARKEAMTRMGLSFFDDVAGDGFAEDLEKELAEDEDSDVKMADVKTDPDGTSEPPPTPAAASVKMELDTTDSKTESISPPPPSTTEPPERELSKREMNRLKRKRKDGNAFVSAVSSSSAAQMAKSMHEAAPSPKVRVLESENGPSAKPSDVSQTPEVVVDDAPVIDSAKGGQVTANEKATNNISLAPSEGHWPWQRLVEVLEIELVNPNWEVRQGAATALGQIIGTQGATGGMKDYAEESENAVLHEIWSNQLAHKCLAVLVLDRFSDFVSDQTMSPVREVVSQLLAHLLQHMNRRSVLHVHSVLLEMVHQKDVSPTGLQPPPHNGTNGSTPRIKHPAKASPPTTHAWQVRHSGLTGLKYEVAVREDLVDVKQEGGRNILKGVVNAALLGLEDNIDDVRSVAASCLIPIAQQMVESLSDDIGPVMDVLWRCLADMKDDLGASVGSVMELLGKLVSFDQVIALLSDSTKSRPLASLAPILYPFFRHTIPSVRLAVVQTFLNFLHVEMLLGDWITRDFVRLLFQNLIFEERADIRDVTTTAWRIAIHRLTGLQRLESTVFEVLPVWFSIVMNPIGVPIDTELLFRPVKGDLQLHNVDKPMLIQDLSLVSEELILRGRIAASKALSFVLSNWPVAMQYDVFHYYLTFYDVSRSMLQRYLAAIIVQEWAIEIDKESTFDPPPSLTDSSILAAELAGRLIIAIGNSPLVTYHEMLPDLGRICQDCRNLLSLFNNDSKMPPGEVPELPSELDVEGKEPNKFSLDMAERTVSETYISLRPHLGKSRRKDVTAIEERRIRIVTSIERYKQLKKAYDVRVASGVASAVVALRKLPDKKNPVIHGVMDGTKFEDNPDLQERSALSVVAFVSYIAPQSLSTKVNPAEKIIKNLCTFICADESLTPLFAEFVQIHDGITSNKRAQPTIRVKKGAAAKVEVAEAEKLSPEKLQRRGALLALSAFGDSLGPQLFERLPKLWDCMTSGLLSTYSADITAAEADDSPAGQSILDNLTVIQGVAPRMHPELLSKMQTVFPYILGALKSRYAIIRSCAASCFSVLCDVFTVEAMRHIVEFVVPRLGDATQLATRQGAMELVTLIVQLLDLKALPYVIFLVVPVLGRMSDVDDDVRFSATNTFASLIKMVPLEAGLPDPEGFSPDLLQMRDTERQFLAQLLDGSKVEPYKIPIEVDAELRKYQQDGVNWLAFLAKYQLHGILCDDMGLGKTLQSICILASKHYERQAKWLATHDSLVDWPDHLPSLVICPPTLTAHWQHEIQTYVKNLRVLQYVGSSRERAKVFQSLREFDVIITSYDVVRNDVQPLSQLNWLYCILDEGHVIKNAKTMLTKAVKCMRAHHRLILSGTPIQNNVLELWSLFDFLMPGFLGTEQSFNQRFTKPIEAGRDDKNSRNAEAAAAALEALHKQVLPFLLRRLKEDVLSDLPPKIISDYVCELSDLQKAMYDEFTTSRAQQNAAESVKTDGAKGAGQTHVFQSLQYLRKLCNHPALVIKPDEVEMTSQKYDIHLGPLGLRDIAHAPKLQALRQLLNDCGIGCPKEEEESKNLDVTADQAMFTRHRVLIFCQMKQMIEMIETDLFQQLMPEVTYMRLDGTVEPCKRHAIVQTFNADPSINCLLLTTQVGGLGLTLTGADTVIFVEHDWNPMKDLQAMDRAHRLGQKKVVNVYRLITKGTLEEKIMGLQRFKLNIANSVVTQQNASLSSMDTDLVLDLFRRTTDAEDAAKKDAAKKKEASGAVTQKNLLDGLEDLPPEDEYDSLSFTNFIGSLKNGNR